MDLLLLKDAHLPGFDTPFGGNAVGERALGGVGGFGLAVESRDGAVYLGRHRDGHTQAAALPGRKRWGAGGVREAR